MWMEGNPTVVVPDPRTTVCTVKGMVPRQPSPRTLPGADLNRTASPFGLSNCAVQGNIDTSAGTIFGWTLPISFGFFSLKDLGTWTIECTGNYFLLSDCHLGGRFCDLECDDPSRAKPWNSSLTWTVTVQNQPARVSLAPLGPFHVSDTPTFVANASDPDGTSVTIPSWVFSGPSQLAPVFLSGNEAATVKFDSANSIGDWKVVITTVDTQGEVTDNSFSFKVVDRPPEIKIKGSVNPVSLEQWEIFGKETIQFNLDVTDLDMEPTTLDCSLALSPNGRSLPAGSVLPTGSQQQNNTLLFTPTKSDFGDWGFRCRAHNVHGSSSIKGFVVTVKPKLPTISLTGAYPPLVPLGGNISLVQANKDGYGDPLKSLQWDLIQGPGTKPTQTDDIESRAMLFLSNPEAGTWRFRLTIEDDAGFKAVDDNIFAFVNSDPHAEIAKPGPVNILKPFTLDGSKSGDADFDNPHWTIDPNKYPIKRLSRAPSFQWKIVEVPPQADLSRYYPGNVDDVLGADGTGAQLLLGPGALSIGDWKLGLDVTDSENNTESDAKTITVAGPNVSPVVVLTPRMVYTTDAQGKLLDGLDVAFDGSASYDLDAFLQNGGWAGGLGIQSYLWTLLGKPPNCNLAFNFGNQSRITLFTVNGAPVSPQCLGAYNVGLTVTDADQPQAHSASRDTTAVIVNCGQALCIDDPTTSRYSFIPIASDTDVLISYHLNSQINNLGIYENQSPYLTSGLYVRLIISKSTGNQSEVVFSKAYEIDPSPNSAGGARVLHWYGYDDSGKRPASGKYDVSLIVSQGFGTNPITVTQPRAIWIETLEVALNSVDKYVDWQKLPNQPMPINWDYKGSFDPQNPGFDQLQLRMLDAQGTEVGKQYFPANSPKTLKWDGKFNTGSVVQPGDYQIELSAMKGGNVLGVSATAPLTVYQVGFHLTGGKPLPKMVPLLFANTDDDDFNGVADLNEPTHAGEDDLVEVFFDVKPATLAGTLTLSSGGHFNVWPTADKLKSQISLPASFQTGSIPASVFLEGVAPSLTNLKADFVTQGAVALDQAVMSIDLCELMVSYDMDGDFKAGPADGKSLFLTPGLWDFAFRTAADANGPIDTLYNQPDEQNNFVGRDSQRFYVQLNDPAANTDPTVVETIALPRFNWWTVKADGVTDDDRPPDPGLTLTETDKDTGLFTSFGLMLVTDPGDVSQPSNTPFGNISFGASNHRTRKIDGPDGAVKLTYQSSLPSGPLHTMRIPLFQRAPEYRRVLTVHIYNFSDLKTGTGPAPQSTINAFVENAKERFALMGIRLKVIYDPLRDQLDVPMGIPANISQVNSFSFVVGTSYDTLHPSGDEIVLINLVKQADPNVDNDTIRAILINQFMSMHRGESLPDGFISGNNDKAAYANFIFVESMRSSPNDFAHEIGHMLTNQTLTDDEARGRPAAVGWAPGGHYGQDATLPVTRVWHMRFNLMWEMGSVTGRGIGDPKRVWNDNSHFKQIDRARFDLVMGVPMDNRYLKLP